MTKKILRHALNLMARSVIAILGDGKPEDLAEYYIKKARLELKK